MGKYRYRDHVSDLHKLAKEQGYTGEAVERMLHECGEQLRESHNNWDTAEDTFRAGIENTMKPESKAT